MMGLLKIEPQDQPANESMSCIAACDIAYLRHVLVANQKHTALSRRLGCIYPQPSKVLKRLTG